ncbi:diablo, IAP-binding mitochondrial protein b [Ictalurus furcatus]|uniref:diablo, IAP-binding mitochondrial protein b n=1 Tax=Ictalurus furcatus TaxID=66913 RepID=UPI002350F60A|nr:diablo, IAP-binding mitochondrial protein b [Ictalurus furcatus]
MALYGRKILAAGRSVVSFWSTAIRTRQILIRLPSVIRRNWISVGISGGLCAVPFVQDRVSHEALIRRASSLVTDSANTFLSQTTLALVDSLTQYTKAVHTLISLHKRYVVNINRLNPADESAIWQVILNQREELLRYREDCKQFERKWMNAVNLTQMAAEAAFNAGADQASVTAQTNLQLAQTHVEQARQRSLEAEQELKDSKAEVSQRLQNTSPAVAGNEEEIPEAYLRED